MSVSSCMNGGLGGGGRWNFGGGPHPGPQSKSVSNISHMKVMWTGVPVRSSVRTRRYWATVRAWCWSFNRWWSTEDARATAGEKRREGAINIVNACAIKFDK